MNTRLANSAPATVGASILLALSVSPAVVVSQPAWSLGTGSTVIDDDGTPERQFTRVVGAVRLPNGSVVVADGGSAELRLFNVNGKFLRTLARRGSGPGELQSLEWLTVVNHGIAAGSATGYSLFSAEGSFVGRMTVSPGNPAPGRATLRGVFAGGQGVFMSGAFSRLVRVDGVRRDSTTIAIKNLASSSEPLTIGRFASFSSLTLLIPSAPGGVRFGRLKYAPQLAFALGSDVLWLGDTNSDSAIRVSAGDGSRLMIKLPIKRAPWNRAELASLRSAAEKVGDPSQRTFELAQLDPRWLPAQAPLFTAFASDKQGNLWIELFTYRPDQPQSFLILSVLGRPIGKLQLPRKARLLEIGADYLVLAESDANDVDRVIVHSLVRR